MASIDLSTTYLGLQLANPFMTGASPLADHLDTVRRLEDAGCAGAIGRRLRALGAEPLNPEARLVERLAPEGEGEVRALVQGSSHGRYLRRLGARFARDVEFCARLDAIDRAYAV